MNSLLNQPGFAAYVVTCLVLCTNLLFLWVYSGAVRNRTKELGLQATCTGTRWASAHMSS